MALNKTALPYVLGFAQLLAVQACNKDTSNNQAPNNAAPKVKDNEVKKLEQESKDLIAALNKKNPEREISDKAVDEALEMVSKKYMSAEFIYAAIKGGKRNKQIEAQIKSLAREIKLIKEELNSLALDAKDKKAAAKTLKQTIIIQDSLNLILLFRRHYNAGTYPKIQEVRQTLNVQKLENKKHGMSLRFYGALKVLLSKRAGISKETLNAIMKEAGKAGSGK